MAEDFEKIKSNWEKYEKFCHRLSDSNLNGLLESLGERLLLCPASMKTSQYGAFPGGLVEHALQVAVTMRKLNDVHNLNQEVRSILLVGLLHEIGKVGSLDHDFYIDQDSGWHREKLGQNYKYNEDLSRMSISHQTLWLLQHFNVKLTREEWLAIQMAAGSHFEENRFYVNHEPSLALLLQHAKAVVIHKSTNG